MTQEIDIYGIFVPGLMIFAILAGLITFFLRKVLAAVRFYRIVWHPALFDLALFFVALGLVFIVATGTDSLTLPRFGAF